MLARTVFGLLLMLLCSASFQNFSSFSAADDSATSSSSQQKSDEASGLTVELRQSEKCGEFAIIGLGDVSRWSNADHSDLQEHFKVSVKSSHSNLDTPALLGTYQVTDKEIRFVSRFPLSSHVHYQVALGADLSSKGSPSEFVFAARTRTGGVPTSVTNIFPSSDVLPENTLKFYIHFSAPMSRGEAYERIRLYQDDREVDAPFLELGEELWDADQIRFTLFIHPGRIKRGVKPREDSGLPLTDGKNYSLVIDQQWKNAEGEPLAKRFVKAFKAKASDEDQPDPEKWRIGTPRASTTNGVTLTFNESLDHAMLSRVLKVLDSDRQAVVGNAQVSEQETVWTFVPAVAWKKGVYVVEVASNIEDLAGNSIARPFETRSGVETDSSPPPPRVAIEFVVE